MNIQNCVALGWLNQFYNSFEITIFTFDYLIIVLLFTDDPESGGQQLTQQSGAAGPLKGIR
jgi:hypothetical protein